MILRRFWNTQQSRHIVATAFAALCLVVATLVSPLGAKGIAPSNAACDHLAKGASPWLNCVARTHDHATDDELFYAGYWLTKSGRHAEALTYLNRTKIKTDRVLTYIGYATRKSGDIDAALDYYAKALVLNPDFVVARSYLGEAHLAQGQRASASAELIEIANRCGTSCAAYTDLEKAIIRYDTQRG